MWPRSIGTSGVVIHADGKIECTRCLTDLGSAREAYRHKRKCLMACTQPRANETDVVENQYLAGLRLVGQHGDRTAMKRSKTLFDMYRYNCIGGSSLQQMRARTLVQRFLNTRLNGEELTNING